MAHEDVGRIAALIKRVAANRTVLMVEHNLGRGREPVATRSPCWPAARCWPRATTPSVSRNPAGDPGLHGRIGPRWLSRCWRSAISTPGTASPTSCTASTSTSAGRGGHAARPQRRRQDDDAQVGHGHRAPADRLGALRRRRADRPCPRTRSRGSASPSAPRSAGSSPASTSRRTCCCRRACGRAGSRVDADLRPVPEPAGAAAQPGHQAVGRRAADAGDRPHPADGRPAAAARRADRGAGAGHRAADRRARSRRLKAEGFTILLVEQNFRFAATVADRHYVMEHGRVVDMIPTPSSAASMDKLHEYLGV